MAPKPPARARDPAHIKRRHSSMCNSGCSWIIIIVLILLCCGGCGNFGGCGGNFNGCNNDCGCGNCGGNCGC